MLAVALVFNGALGFAYRLYRRARGGALGDVVGQAALATFLCALAVALALGAQWARWAALGFAVLFALAVMPLWVLAVFIPSRPGAPDYAFLITYSGSLILIGVAAVAA